jgi:predicted TIM-barrel fold metal-dependent hydrolase
MTVEDILGDIRVIDADSHVTEPYDLWTSRVSVKRWGDKVPHVVWDDERQADIWLSGDTYLGRVGANATAGYEKPWPNFPPRWADLKPEVWRAQDRLDMMTRHGIHAAILYPNVSGFGAGNFANVVGEEAELALDLIRAYNDFLIDYCSADPRRFVPVMAVPFWDVNLSIAEMERAASRGHRGIIFSQQPELYGCPMLGDRAWDDLWAAAQAMELSINFHIGSGSIERRILPLEAGKHTNAAGFPVMLYVDNCRSIISMILGGVCHRFPDLKIVSVESGIGWIPFVLQSLDWMWMQCDIVGEHPEYDLLPSEYFKRQIYGCFWFEHGHTLDAAMEYLGEDHILYETDFPHPVCMSPGPATTAPPANEFIAEHLGYLPEATLRKVLHDNAASLYKID